ncbi:hypothetical protein JR316_0009358 [Psilocybe cubensis]|nr:hypothetical protein JR316_0009358 [Psilocybe cubensis]KAH9478896.1 hypothetical protein JR316_0009358 [Psilocybe cubensis]
MFPPEYPPPVLLTTFFGVAVVRPSHISTGASAEFITFSEYARSSRLVRSLSLEDMSPKYLALGPEDSERIPEFSPEEPSSRQRPSGDPDWEDYELNHQKYPRQYLDHVDNPLGPRIENGAMAIRSDVEISSYTFWTRGSSYGDSMHPRKFPGRTQNMKYAKTRGRTETPVYLKAKEHRKMAMLKKRSVSPRQSEMQFGRKIPQVCEHAGSPARHSQMEKESSQRAPLTDEERSRINAYQLSLGLKNIPLNFLPLSGSS